MKVTTADMDRPDFWTLQFRAERVIENGTGITLASCKDDRAAKAFADAVETLTKFFLVQAKNEPEMTG